MRNTPETIARLHNSLEYVKKLPDNVYFSFTYDGSILIEVDTQEELKKVRSCFGRVVWGKKYKEYAQWWTYTGKTKTGVNVMINGVKEAPARCRAVEVTETRTERVPVSYEEKEVTTTRIKYICPGDSKKVD